MEKSTLILVVDDDSGMVELIRGLLEINEFKVDAAYDGEEALKKARDIIPDLIILDWTMPRMDGWEVCRSLRKDKKTENIPIIMLTSRNTPEDEVIGLEVGVDDFMNKPFNNDVFIARINTVLRRYAQENKRELKSGNIYINLDKHAVLIDDQPVSLWPKEFDLLYFMMKKQGDAVSRDNLLESVWGYQYFGTTRTVDATIKRLRKKMGAQSDRIETIKGIGYRFTEE
ncbi:MAG: response regulator transcription factor [Elusimicrobiota bacterium]